MHSAEQIRIASVVALYFAVSITLVFANKLLMSSTEPKNDAGCTSASIPVPLFVTWFQCVLTAVIIYVCGKIANRSTSTVLPSASAQESSCSSFLREFPIVTYDLRVAGGIFPLSLMFVGMITFNNLCLMYVTVAFYQVARSLTIVANVIFTYFFLNESTSFKTLLCLLVVICGFFVGIDGEIEFSMIGTIFGVLSSCFVSLNAIFTKRAMPLVEGDKWKLSFYNNVNAAFIFFPLIFLTGEYTTLTQCRDVLASTYYWIVMSIAGVLGFAIGIVTVMQIHYTSPLTHNISGTAKACVQTLLSLTFFNTPYTLKGLSGIGMTIFGSLAYALVRMREADSAKKQPAIPSSAGYAPVARDDPDDGPQKH